MPKAKHAREVKAFTDIPNIGRATAGDFATLKIATPQDLVGRDPYVLYADLCRITKARHDPCCIDVFIAAVRFMEGSKPLPWWHYTPERKAFMAASSRAIPIRTRGSVRPAAAKKASTSRRRPSK